MKGRFKQVLGTGGIGTGSIWYLADDRPLGRSESRPARLSEARDYCKQHIILHYLAAVMAPEAEVLPMGMVGRDAAGEALLAQMAAVGMDTRFVRPAAEGVTMQSVCLHYPDKSVCNLTADNSASAAVDENYIQSCLAALGAPPGPETVIMAAPEVPLAARLALLRAGAAGGAYTVASVPEEEAGAFLRAGGLALCRLLVINEEEARALCADGWLGEAKQPASAAGEAAPGGVRAEPLRAVGKALCAAEGALCAATDFDALLPALQALAAQGPDIIVTRGPAGASLVAAGGALAHQDAPPAQVVSTAGAGDAFTAGVICGLHLGLPLHGQGPTAFGMGRHFSARAVQCLHTIDDGLDRAYALAYLNK